MLALGTSEISTFSFMSPKNFDFFKVKVILEEWIHFIIIVIKK